MNEALPKRRPVLARARTGKSAFLSTCLSREAASVPLCRQLVREALTDWKLPDVADTAELVVSELASNAVQHAGRGAIRLTLCRLADDRVHVAVIDKSRALPVPAAPSPEEVGGRGLAIIDALSLNWGTDTLPWGKRVWAEVGLGEPQASGDPLSWDPDNVPIRHSPAAQTLYVVVVVAVMAVLAYGIASR